MSEPSISDLLWESAEIAGNVVNRFKEKFRRDMTQVDQDIAVTIFMDKRGRNKGNWNKKQQPELPVVAGEKCPKCSGPMVDARSIKTKPTSPDYLCKNTECKNDKGYRTGKWLEKA
jgi:hypothetical protein